MKLDMSRHCSETKGRGRDAPQEPRFSGLNIDESTSDTLKKLPRRQFAMPTVLGVTSLIRSREILHSTVAGC